jgi:predicted nucleic acid-binding protein
VVTPERIRILVDTNILLRAIQNDSPLCAISKRALKTLHRQNCQLCLTPQNVHDAWLVAAMNSHGVKRILTFNTGDFARYDGIECIDPKAP